MTQRNPTYARPGVPEGRWWHPFAYFGGLLGASALSWALISGVVWAVWIARAYVLVAVCVTAALAVVAYAAHLMIKPDRRSRVRGVVIFVALVALILVVLPR